VFIFPCEVWDRQTPNEEPLNELAKKLCSCEICSINLNVSVSDASLHHLVRAMIRVVLSYTHACSHAKSPENNKTPSHELSKEESFELFP
jgi:hypothetical protein